MPEGLETREQDLLEELDRLEQQVGEVTRLVQVLREENRRLQAEHDRLREERQTTVGRLGRLIERVDALRGEL